MVALLTFRTWSILLLLFSTMLVLSMGEPRKSKMGKKEDSSKQREGKLFSLFNVVQFKNDPCQTTESIPSGGFRAGTCRTATECTKIPGGSAKGNCAAGFGVCCLTTTSTATGTGTFDVTQNNTYLLSPTTSTGTGGTVTYNVKKSQPDICYLRLDFAIFSIGGLGGTGDFDATTTSLLRTCGTSPSTDSFSVTPNPLTSGQVVPIICGENSGQHMYLDLGTAASDSATLTFNIGTVAAATPRKWDIKTSQYTCYDKNAPPQGCLQYHTGLTGSFRTFNYDAATDNHLPNQQYSVCIRQENGFCCVQYRTCQPPMTPDLSFSLSLLATAMQDSTCATEDYIGIADSSSSCYQGQGNIGYKSRYCGMFFNDVAAAIAHAPICDCTSPFRVDVYTNSLDDVPATASKGVCLEWTQLPCTG